MTKFREFIDLRSDTVTLPTDEMLEAIRNARLGDDVFKEDPSVNQLEEMAANKMGKDAALLVTSGTQANLVSLICNTKRGDLVILESECHIYYSEVGGLSAVAGLLPWPIKGNMGVLNPTDIAAALRPKNIHFPEATLVCIENTHNRAGGTVTSLEEMRNISEVVHSNGLRLYMDGARIFNAAVALGVDVRQISKHVDSMMFCLSKGLSCPIGSLVVGNQEFIDKARKTRKMLGGGMRQAGIIAAPGIIALEKMIDRLKKDHLNARLLAEGLARIDGISVDVKNVETNIVNADLAGLGVPSSQFASELKEHGILILTRDERNVRLVTHRGIEKEHITESLNVIDGVVRKIHGQSL